VVGVRIQALWWAQAKANAVAVCVSVGKVRQMPRAQAQQGGG